MSHSLRLMRWTDVLLAINRAKDSQCYSERLCKVLQCSRTYIRVIVALLVKNRLVQIIEKKNVKQLVLTEHGRRVTSILRILRQELPHPNSIRQNSS